MAGKDYEIQVDKHYGKEDIEKLLRKLVHRRIIKDRTVIAEKQESEG